MASATSLVPLRTTRAAAGAASKTRRNVSSPSLSGSVRSSRISAQRSVWSQASPAASVSTVARAKWLSSGVAKSFRRKSTCSVLSSIRRTGVISPAMSDRRRPTTRGDDFEMRGDAGAIHSQADPDYRRVVTFRRRFACAKNSAFPARPAGHPAAGAAARLLEFDLHFRRGFHFHAFDAFHQGLGLLERLGILLGELLKFFRVCEQLVEVHFHQRHA